MYKKILTAILIFALALAPAAMAADGGEFLKLRVDDITASPGDIITVPIYVDGHSGVAAASVYLTCPQFTTTKIDDGEWVMKNKSMTNTNLSKGLLNWIYIYNVKMERQTGIFALYTLKINEDAEEGEYEISLRTADIVKIEENGGASSHKGETVTAKLTVEPYREPVISIHELEGENEPGTIRLGAEVDPAGFEVKWESSDTSVAEVENGVVTITGAGEAVIKASVTSRGEIFYAEYRLSYGMGDINFDGNLSNADIVLMSQYVVGLAELNQSQLKLFDISGDGIANNADIVNLAQMIIS